MGKRFAAFWMLGCLLLCTIHTQGIAEEASPFTCIVEEYRRAVRDPHYDSEFAGSFISVEWRDYVDDPRSEPAYAFFDVDGQRVLLIGDRKDPQGMIRSLYIQDDGEVSCLLNSNEEDTWYILSDGTAARQDTMNGQAETAEIAWNRFWNSRKAIVAEEDAGGVISRSGLDENSYTLGRQETGLVIIVDEVENGWAWYRYHAVRDGVSAASWGYMPSDKLIYPENAEAIGTGVLAKNGKTDGNIIINIRFRPTTKSGKILELPVGTAVDVYGSENGWTEIEWNRWHGYVKNEFIQQNIPDMEISNRE